MWRMLSSSAAASGPAAVDLHRPHRLLRGCLRWFGTLHAPKLWRTALRNSFFEYIRADYRPIHTTLPPYTCCTVLQWAVRCKLIYCSLETRGRLLLKTSLRYFRTIRHNTRLFRHWRFGPSFSSAAFSALQYVMGIAVLTGLKMWQTDGRTERTVYCLHSIVR